MKGIIRKGSKAEERLFSVIADLQKRADSGKLENLTLSDYQCITMIGKELVEKCVASTFIKKVADYYKSFGFLVTKDFDNIHYVIVA